ncbi:VOC family protein [Sandaracinobacteroides hominis]|uniref:VOC family protein n=1 Tax=Sandaracinobacteroides hominis TaxID=2780086 RepID=UPI0018F4478A|nr:VOC family protein [Sandaracinobacteroides hominis]
MEQRLSIVTLGTSDLGRATAFWEAMGLERKGKYGGVAFFQLNGVALAIYPFEKLAEDCGLPGGVPAGGVTIAYNTRSEAEVDAVLAEAVAAGGKLQVAAHKAFWGGYSGYFLDPDGHPWEVAYNPFFELGLDGEVILPA